MTNLKLQLKKSNALKAMTLVMLISSSPLKAADEDIGGYGINSIQRQTYVEDLKSEMSSYKKMRRGKKVRRVGEMAGKAARGLKYGAPVVGAISAAVPSVAPILGLSYAGLQGTLKGANKVLPCFGDAIELKNAHKLSASSYVEGELSEEERAQLIRRNNLEEIAKLSVQVDYLQNLSARKQRKYADLIEMKARYLEAYLDKIRE